jgi:hypothetical protein
MVTRSEEKQREHDLIVNTSYKTWIDRGDVKAFANPGEDHNFAVAGIYYPDIVVLDKNNNLYLIEEVETEETVIQEEVEEWKQFSSFGVLLNLIVPEEKREEALKLISGISNIRVQTYTFKNGQLEFHL